MNTETCYNGEQEHNNLSSATLPRGKPLSGRSLETGCSGWSKQNVYYFQSEMHVGPSGSKKAQIENLMGTKSAGIYQEQEGEAMDDIKTHVAEMRSDIKYISGDMKDIKSDVKTLSTETIPSIKTNLAVLNNNVEKISDSFNTLNNRAIAIIIAIVGSFAGAVLLRVFGII